MVRPGGNYVEYLITPSLQIAGDFDVIAEFEGFDATIDAGGDANIKLMLGFAENSADYRLYRKFSRYAKKELGQQMIQAAYFYTREGERSYEFPKHTSEAATGGKLRLVRRGDKLHFLFAADDSDYYRLLHSEHVTTAATRPGGFALGIETTKAGQATVVWKSIEVRAQQLTGCALEASLTPLQLDESRDRLPRVVDLDFTESRVKDHIRLWETAATYQYQSDGLLVAAPGFKDWHGHGLSVPIALQGDFDVQLDLQVKHIEAPQEGGECVVYLETRFQDRLSTSIQAKFAMSPSGLKNGEISHLFTAGTGEMHYKELVHYPLKSVEKLRLARRDKTVYVLVQETQTSQPVILGRVKLEDDAVASGTVHAVLHTAGVGRKTVALFKRMAIRAESITE
jgi:hypothetical protein